MPTNGYEQTPEERQTEAQRLARERGEEDGWQAARSGYEGRAEGPEKYETRGESAARRAASLYPDAMMVQFVGAVRQEYREGYLAGGAHWDADLRGYFPEKEDEEP